jgi:hypothetical protein
MRLKPKVFNLTIALFFIHIHPFSEDIKTAVKFLEKEKTTISQIKNTSATEGGEALAIAFPELLRWNAFNDFLETAAVELIYIQNGSKSNDFSIGHFQMKPSFIEQMETYIATHETLKIFDYVVIKEKTEVENRKKRVYQLKQWAWQLRYAHVFWLVAQDKFKHRTFKNKQERVRFYATAYNYGFLRPENEIESRLYKAQFPYGSKYEGEQVAYGDLAVEFFDNYAKNF